jgi:hypothetical protein
LWLEPVGCRIGMQLVSGRARRRRTHGRWAPPPVRERKQGRQRRRPGWRRTGNGCGVRVAE